MSEKSPFAVASITANPGPAPTPGFAAQLYVNGVARVGKTDYVAIKSRDTPDPGKPSVIFLEVGKSTPDGMRVERLNWSDQTGKSTVDVIKNGEKATLVFDAEVLKSAPTVQSLVPGQPGVRLPALPGQPRIGFPIQNGPFNRPGYQQPQLNGLPGQPNAGLPGVEVRRRFRTIQSGQ